MPDKKLKPDITIEEKSLKEIPKKKSVYDERPYGIEDNRHVTYQYKVERGEKEPTCITYSLCNFLALVKKVIYRDNGFESQMFYAIDVVMNNSRTINKSIEIPVKQFKTMDWVWELGPHAIMNAGNSSQEKLREAILYESTERSIEERFIFQHTGWREIDGEMFFLSANGAVGNHDISVELDKDLEHYCLLDPEGDPKEAIKSSLEFLLIAPMEVTLPLLAAVYLAPLTEISPQMSAFTIWLSGESGAYKSTINSLALSHFGDFDRITNPANWKDTANSIEEKMSQAKDVVFNLDDFAPAADRNSQSEMEKKAERIIRSQGDRAGRGRMYSVRKFPRGLLITSGEMLTSGYSRTARIITLEIKRGETNTLFMSDAQKNKYQYCKAMTHYIVWIKNNWSRLKKNLPTHYINLRDELAPKIGADSHPRMPEIISGLIIGLETAVEYALDKGALTKKEADDLLIDGQEIFISLAKKQASRVDAQRAGRQFLDYIKTMYHQGIAKFTPRNSELQPVTTSGSYFIGWSEVDPDDSSAILYYLDMTAAVAAVKKFTDNFVWNEDAVKKDLDIMKKIVDHDKDRREKNLRIGKSTQRVIVLRGLD